MKKQMLILTLGIMLAAAPSVEAQENSITAIHEQNKGIARIHRTCSKEELEILAHLINGEAGANYCSDDMMYYVGSVALNRVKSDRFPNDIKSVVFQRGQYACTWDGNYYLEPSDRAWEIASDLLHEGSILPDSVLWQAEFRQGKGVYLKEQNMYFCFD